MELNPPSELTPLVHKSKSKNLESQELFDSNSIKHVDLATAVERKYISKEEGVLIDGIMEVFPEAYRDHFEPRFSDQVFSPTVEQLAAHGVKPSEASKYEVTGVLLDQKMGKLKTDAKHLAVMFRNADTATLIHEFGEFAHKRLISSTDVKNVVNPAYKKSGSNYIETNGFQTHLRIGGSRMVLERLFPKNSQRCSEKCRGDCGIHTGVCWEKKSCRPK